MRTILVLLLLVPHIAVGTPRTRSGELVYGAGVTFMVRAPSGWVLDSKSGRAQGLDAVFYPRGSSFQDTHALVFARAVPKHDQAFAQVIDDGVAAMRKQAPRLEVDRPSTWTCGEKSARLLTIAHDPAGNVEALAFVDEPDVVIVLGLMAEDASRRAAAMPRLRELCASYRFVGPVAH